MKQYVSFDAMIDAFQAYGRESQFSYDALKSIFDYYEEIEDATGEEIEFDVIGICCDWTEYDDCLDAVGPGFECDPDLDPDEMEEDARAYLEARTTVIYFPGGIVVGAW